MLIWSKAKLQALKVSVDQLKVNALQSAGSKKNTGVGVAGSCVLPAADRESDGSPSARALQYQGFTD